MTSPQAQEVPSVAAAKAEEELRSFTSPTSFVARWTSVGLPNVAIEFDITSAVKIAKETAQRDLEGLDAGVEIALNATER